MKTFFPERMEKSYLRPENYTSENWGTAPLFKSFAWKRRLYSFIMHCVYSTRRPQCLTWLGRYHWLDSIRQRHVFLSSAIRHTIWKIAHTAIIYSIARYVCVLHKNYAFLFTLRLKCGSRKKRLAPVGNRNVAEQSVKFANSRSNGAFSGWNEMPPQKWPEFSSLCLRGLVQTWFRELLD